MKIKIHDSYNKINRHVKLIHWEKILKIIVLYTNWITEGHFGFMWDTVGSIFNYTIACST